MPTFSEFLLMLKAETVNPASKRRPIIDRKPVPWIGGSYPSQDEWAGIDNNRVRQATQHKLCIMCGLELADNYVYSNFDGEIHDKNDVFDPETASFEELFQFVEGKIKLKGAPTPTFVHPRCALQAAAFCPHLKALDHPALDKQGNPMTREDLRKLSDIHDNANSKD